MQQAVSYSLRTQDSLTPLGHRGERPVHFWVGPETAQPLLCIPGVWMAPGGVDCSWDASPAVARALGVQPPPLQLAAAPQLPGLEHYKALGMHQKLRPYQFEMAEFLALRAYAINADPLRSGKTITTIAAAIARGSKKTLTICPAIAKLVWASEIGKWTKGRALLLYGRAADEAREFCIDCMGSGLTPGGEAHCPSCRTKNGQSFGWSAVYTGTAEVQKAIEAHEWIIVNYDLLVPQSAHEADGKKFLRADLPGWANMLAVSRFDLAIADEVHFLRGRSTKARRKLTRRERTLLVTDPIPTVWGLSGTPFFGKVADGWGLLDVVTAGLFGRPHFTFDVRHCAGGKTGFNNTWQAKGATNVEELRKRLSYFMLKRERKDIMRHCPPKTRQVIRLEVDAPSVQLSRRGGAKSGIAAALRATAEIKVPFVVDNVLAEMSEGNKVIVFTYLKANAERLAKAIADGCKKGEMGARMKAVLAKVWLVHGGVSSDARFKMAQAFREWTGAGAIVATIDSMQVALSLKGAASVHFADLHYDPSALLQAEDRPFDEGIGGLTILYYIVRGTVDEHVISVVIPKMETLEQVVSERGATEFREALVGKRDDSQLAEEIWARMLKCVEVTG